MLVKFITKCYNKAKFTNLFNYVGDIIRKTKGKRKIWLDNHSRRLLEQKSKSNKNRNSRSLISSNEQITHLTTGYRASRTHFVIKAPNVFSIEKNPEATIQFFNSILDKKHEHIIGAHFYIDSSCVLEVTVDALMYLIAIISDAKYNTVFRYIFEGNFPESKDAKKVYVDSGFLTFVLSDNGYLIKPSTTNIQILQGHKTDSPTASKVCEFVQEHCSLTRVDTIPLYNILVELMGNTQQHAYRNESDGYKSANFWYLFAEKKLNYVEFVFLDTGLGIPTTVRKSIGERFPFINKDADFIKSALNGDFRTETKEPHRGKGLPQISDCFKSGLLQDISVYSGKGCCTLCKTNCDTFSTFEYKNKIFGTLFCWKMSNDMEAEHD